MKCSESSSQFISHLCMLHECICSVIYRRNTFGWIKFREQEFSAETFLVHTHMHHRNTIYIVHYAQYCERKREFFSPVQYMCIRVAHISKHTHTQNQESVLSCNSLHLFYLNFAYVKKTFFAGDFQKKFQTMIEQKLFFFANLRLQIFSIRVNCLDFMATLIHMSLYLYL